jgi:hypothetical protein
LVTVAAAVAVLGRPADGRDARHVAACVPLRCARQEHRRSRRAGGSGDPAVLADREAPVAGCHASGRERPLLPADVSWDRSGEARDRPASLLLARHRRRVLARPDQQRPGPLAGREEMDNSPSALPVRPPGATRPGRAPLAVDHADRQHRAHDADLAADVDRGRPIVVSGRGDRTSAGEDVALGADVDRRVGIVVSG